MTVCYNNAFETFSLGKLSRLLSGSKAERSRVRLRAVFSQLHQSLQHHIMCVLSCHLPVCDIALSLIDATVACLNLKLLL
jgi:hypothetical protein